MHFPSDIKLFGLQIAGTDMRALLSFVRCSDKPVWIVTANPEMLVYAKTHPIYAETLRNADARIADGVGIVLAGFTQGAVMHRVTGVDLAEELIRWAAEDGLTVGIIGGGKGVAAKAFLHVLARFPMLKGFVEDGGCVDHDGNGDDEHERATNILSMNRPDILLVAFGHPKQEMWIEKNRIRFPHTRVIVGVGGTIDYWAGTFRAPTWMRHAGFEWLYRLVREPRRWKRILTAVAVFPALVLADRMRWKRPLDR